MWMVDLTSQFSYYNQLQTLMLLGGTQTTSTPEDANATIPILDKSAVVEKKVQAPQALKSLDIAVNAVVVAVVKVLVEMQKQVMEIYAKLQEP
ncbi:Hypothetical protein PHPALM_8791 [Phytophthora palmivora]|uniref:Uncharacterized protein n=1 Tax=Phytophthora palmivora TaxID=4796 RepID=A0A2P4Y9D5_9STRA|nr:Hypothetical protein PHPALM_8791 [Phytophthora palmivora]